MLIIRPSVVYGPGNPDSTNIYRLIDAIYNNRFAMVGPGEAIKSTSYIDNLLAATLFLMERMERGVQTYIYVDEPALSTGQLVKRIYQLLEKEPPSWHIPLERRLAHCERYRILAAVTGIDFPITAARIEKFNRSTNFDASAIRGRASSNLYPTRRHCAPPLSGTCSTSMARFLRTGFKTGMCGSVYVYSTSGPRG